MLNLFVLLYADDTVIMAENECGMQRNLNLLNEYCNCNGLRVHRCRDVGSEESTREEVGCGGNEDVKMDEWSHQDGQN